MSDMEPNGRRSGKAVQWAAGPGLAVLLLCSQTTRAEIADSAPGGFTLRETAHVAAAPDKVYGALIVPARWWSSEHTFSGNAANMSFDARAGGCWCEALPGGGSVLHMTVVYAVPGKALRMRGALGPFQAMATEGVMTWSLVPAASGTDVTLTYAITGYAKDGFGQIAPAADSVLAKQVARLRSFVETGQPSPAQGATP